MTYYIHRSTKRGDDRYTGYYYDHHGKAVSAGTYPTPAEALTAANHKQDLVDLGFRPTPKLRATMTVAQLAPIFLERHQVSDGTRDDYRTVINNLPKALTGLKVCDLTAVILQNFLDHLADTGTPPAAVRLIRSTLSAMIGFARRLGLRDDNCARGLKIAKVARKGEKAWAADIFAAVRPHFPTKAAETFAALQVLTGARIGELCALRVRDIELSAATMSVTKSVTVLNGKYNDTRLKITPHPKNGLHRTVELSALACNLLSAYITENGLGPEDQLFPHRLVYGHGTKELLSPEHWAYIFRKTFHASGLPERLWIPAKNLRHTHVIDCLEKLGMSPALVAARVGNTKEVLLSNYVVERLTVAPVSRGHLDALDAAYAA